MHPHRTTCATCDIHTTERTTDDFDLPICRWCNDLVTQLPKSFDTILQQRHFLRPMRVKTIDIPQRVTPFQAKRVKKWKRRDERLRRTRGRGTG